MLGLRENCSGCGERKAACAPRLIAFVWLQNKEIFVSEICHRSVCHLSVDTRAVSLSTPAGGRSCTSSPPLPAPPSRFFISLSGSLPEAEAPAPPPFVSKPAVRWRRHRSTSGHVQMSHHQVWWVHLHQRVESGQVPHRGRMNVEDRISVNVFSSAFSRAQSVNFS